MIHKSCRTQVGDLHLGWGRLSVLVPATWAVSCLSLIILKSLLRFVGEAKRDRTLATLCD